jgi:hypothetical protein
VGTFSADRALSSSAVSSRIFASATLRLNESAKDRSASRRSKGV